jgi:hypothetical protein
MNDEMPKGNCDWMPSIWPRDISEALMVMETGGGKSGGSTSRIMRQTTGCLVSKLEEMGQYYNIGTPI